MEVAAHRPDVSLFVLDATFDPVAAAKVPGIRLGLVTRPPLEPSGTWPLSSWLNSGALHGLTWFESAVPPELSSKVVAVLPLAVDRSGLQAPDLAKKGVVIPMWAAPSAPVVSHLGTFAALTMLEANATVDEQLGALDANGVLLSCSHDALGRLDALPLLALARGLLVISVAPFSADWGVEAEDDYLVRREDQFVFAVDEAIRVPETAKAVRMRAFQKAAEFFDASALLKRLVFDTVLRFASERIVPAAAPGLRRGSRA
jgi:hypothetical protein